MSGLQRLKDRFGKRSQSGLSALTLIDTNSGASEEPVSQSGVVQQPSHVETTEFHAQMSPWSQLHKANPLCRCGKPKMLDTSANRHSPFKSECYECNRKRCRENHARRKRVRDFEKQLREMA